MKGINSKLLLEIARDLEASKYALETVKDEAESYYNDRSEKWQDSDVAQLMDEKIGEMDEGIGDLDELIEKLNNIAGD